MTATDRADAVHIGDVEFRPDTGALRRGGTETRLTVSEAAAFTAAARTPGRLVGTDAVLRAIYGDRGRKTPGDARNTLSQFVLRLRGKLRRIGSTLRLERTAGRGLALIAPEPSAAPVAAGGEFPGEGAWIP